MPKKTVPQPRTNLRVVDRALIQAVMFEQGIIPMEKTDIDVGRVLKQVSPDEARQIKRKFRKLWRKAMQKELNDTAPPRTKASKTKVLNSQLGVGKRAPSRAERLARKQLVFDQLWQEIIGPLVRDFENVVTRVKPPGT